MVDNRKKINDLISLESGEWWFRILDVRPLEAFLAGHLKGAVSHPLPPSGGPQGVPSIVLPPRHETLLVVGHPSQHCEDLARDLESRGRAPVTALEVVESDFASLPAALVESGPNRGHLWAPPPWLECHLDLLPPPAKGPVLDLGCGSGRASVFLAERGYQVTGLDHQVEALEMGRQLAASRGVTCDFVQADLRDPAAVPVGDWAVLLAFRFLQRDLVGRFPDLLQPGGVAMVRTFREAPGYSGHPHPRHRLSRGELMGFFPRGQFEVLAHEEGFDPDGRPAAGIVARRY